MDANTTRRAFPGYTLSDLEAKVAAGYGNPAIEAEIAARKSGASVNFKVPQIEGGKAQIRIGRM